MSGPAVLKKTGWGKGAALSYAITYAARSETPHETFRVVRRSLFGPDVTLYEVSKDEDRRIAIITISQED